MIMKRCYFVTKDGVGDVPVWYKYVEESGHPRAFFSSSFPRAKQLI